MSLGFEERLVISTGMSSEGRNEPNSTRTCAKCCEIPPEAKPLSHQNRTCGRRALRRCKSSNNKRKPSNDAVGARWCVEFGAFPRPVYVLSVVTEQRWRLLHGFEHFPARSADTNPIEHVWGCLQRVVSRQRVGGVAKAGKARS